MDRPESGTSESASVGQTGSTPATPVARQRRPSRRRTRIQRIVILAAILVLIVFLLALVLRSCQHNRKVDTYRTYLGAVGTAIDDSASVGKQLDQVVSNPTKYSRKELLAKLGELTAGQEEIAARAASFAPPETLRAQQAVFAEGMLVRAEGFAFFEQIINESLGNETVNPRKIAALDGYFSGPDAYYMSRFYAQTRNVMSEEGVSDVAVPTSTYYLTAKTFDVSRVEDMLSAVGGSSKLSGLHGVALLGVAAQPSDTELKAGSTTKLKATADLAFEARIQNQGDVAEQNLEVKGELKLPDGRVLTVTTSIATIGIDKTQTATLSGFAIPAEALTKVSTLTVTAGPVAGERLKTNNTASYKILLQLE